VNPTLIIIKHHETSLNRPCHTKAPDRSKQIQEGELYLQGLEQLMKKQPGQGNVV
jgi:hypothetical protein